MDTPEADVSAIQSGAMQPLPAYQEHDTSDSDIQPMVSAVDPSDTRHLPPSYDNKIPQSDEVIAPESDSDEPTSCHVSTNDLSEEDALVQARRKIVEGFFDAIKAENPDAIALFIDRKLVTANTTTDDGRTPLLTAVATKNIQTVQLLLDFGAEPDAFGVIDIALFISNLQDEHFSESYTRTERTPLQYAASIGHLPIVKLLHQTYHCSDSVVAPDGQIALRLASKYGHREVVDYLPACRAGGFRRWQVQHERAIERCKSACEKIYKFVKFFVWDLEKFLLWTCPKHLLVLPTVKVCKYCWENKLRFARWCKAQVVKAPGRAKRAAKGAAKAATGVAKGLWKGCKKVPGLVGRTAKGTWRFATQDVPKLSKKLGRWLFNLLFTRIPNAIATLAKWVWGGVTAAAQAMWNVFLKLVSLIHTVLSAIATFFRELTWKDIWNGVRDVLHAAFVGFPQRIWEWLKKFGEVSYKVSKVLFGTLGKVLWYMVVGVFCLLVFVVVYVPKQILEILVSVAGSFAKAWYEVLVWFSPKA